MHVFFYSSLEMMVIRALKSVYKDTNKPMFYNVLQTDPTATTGGNYSLYTSKKSTSLDS